MVKVLQSTLWIHVILPEVVSEKVPSSLKHFLKGMWGKALNKEKKIVSIAQDIIFLHSAGKKMPQNIGLGLVLKRSIRPQELITLLNNLGHSVSYDILRIDILRIDTSWAAGILEANDRYFPVPTNIREKMFTQVFTQLFSDNGSVASGRIKAEKK